MTGQVRALGPLPAFGELAYLLGDIRFFREWVNWKATAFGAQLMHVRVVSHGPLFLDLRGSYSGNTLAFQAKARSSILLPRSIFPDMPEGRQADRHGVEVYRLALSV